VVVALAVLAVVVVAAGGLALYLIVSERRRHKLVEQENALLLEQANLREADHAALSEQVITAEQEERRRIALFLHDGPVQSLSGIGLMLDAAVHLTEQGNTEQAREVLGSALERHRKTIRELRDLSFNLEPVVLRDQGFAMAVRALAEQLGIAHELRIEVEIDAGEGLSERAAAGLYQIIRDALTGAIRRGPPSRAWVRVAQLEGGSVEAVIVDDAPVERRRRTFESLEERARTIGGRASIDHEDPGGTRVSVVIPAYAAQR
jgi:signal transduction histidine kinase